jgi:lipoprotein signal peptidase
LRSASLTSRRTLATLLAVLLPTVGCDRATKHLAEAALKGSAPRSFLGDVVRLHYAENRGAFLSLVSIGLRPVRTGVFNVADAALSIGVVFLLASTARSRSCARTAPK